ncbi:MAG: FkbM family methyltransferase [Bacteroidetes bacterium]|nr:FkbM family methyltransferase [Bacteroidota bacterium]
MGIVQILHRFKFLRRIAKVAARRLIIKQKFYQGYIFLNAVEHAWAWTGKTNYMNFDIELQQYLYRKSRDYDQLIDIGCNIGVMSVGTLLHNTTIRAVSVDPNPQAVMLLKKTLMINRLEDRCTVIRAAVGIEEQTVKFDTEGSVTGHIAAEGETVNMIRISDLLNRHNQGKTLVKIDVEGYESVLVKDLANINNLQDFCFLIEFHEAGFNSVGDPEFVLDTLLKLGGTAVDLSGNPVKRIDPAQISQLVISFN